MEKREDKMGLLNIFKEILAEKNESTMRIGLSGYKKPKVVENANPGTMSIRTKDVKLSDLMRRTNLY